MTKLSKSKWLLAGVVSGALALGGACKSDSGSERAPPPPPAGTETGTGTPDTGTPDTGTPDTGGAGEDSYEWPSDEATREHEPDVHEGTHDSTGGAGGVDEGSEDHRGGSEDTGGMDEGTGGAGTGEDSVIIEGEEVDPGRSGGANGTGPVIDEGVIDEDMVEPDETGGSGTGGSGTDDTGLNEGGNTTEPLPDDTSDF
jgi:hypothetical protein